ncbi:Histo-blood group ABO system transferase [Sciurus carolinensis]|uniref:Histo-blood group ABO system transferase n=2 Tax=Sciurus carolinensis TaxID=30640 RepID=A0AA41N800_SCICA|nr:Histo-blood group ABO system transferase [Sciurus carolinensis]
MLVGESIGVGQMNHMQVVTVSRIVNYELNMLTPFKYDILVETPWMVPIVWEGTFNSELLHEHFQLQNVTIGLAVFAIKELLIFLKLFLETAEEYFMEGYRMKYYIFTDKPESVPLIQLKRGRQMVILEIQSHAHWQNLSMYRMERISTFSRLRFIREVDYLVCADVDIKFWNHVSVEILSSLFGTLHPGFIGRRRDSYDYERLPQSQAHIPVNEGDFYYTGAFFGGSVLEVYKLTKFCHQAMMVDQAHNIKSMWHDESYLNKYLLYHKPTKVLSPEYMWDKNLLKLPVFAKMDARRELVQKITKQSLKDKDF